MDKGAYSFDSDRAYREVEVAFDQCPERNTYTYRMKEMLYWQC